MRTAKQVKTNDFNGVLCQAAAYAHDHGGSCCVYPSYMGWLATSGTPAAPVNYVRVYSDGEIYEHLYGREPRRIGHYTHS